MFWLLAEFTTRGHFNYHQSYLYHSLRTIVLITSHTLVILLNLCFKVCEISKMQHTKWLDKISYILNMFQYDLLLSPCPNKCVVKDVPWSIWKCFTEHSNVFSCQSSNNVRQWRSFDIWLWDAVFKVKFLIQQTYHLLVTVIVVFIITAKCSKTPNTNGIGIEYLCASIHPHLKDKQITFFPS